MLNFVLAFKNDYWKYRFVILLSISCEEDIFVVILRHRSSRICLTKKWHE